MTDKQFWSRLNKICKITDAMKAITKGATLIRDAYDANLGVICGVTHTEKDIVHHLYMNTDCSFPGQTGNRLLLCYTSPNMILSDPIITERPEVLPVRFVVDNALQNPATMGIVFNRHVPNSLIMPKLLLSPDKTFLSALSEFVNLPHITPR